jgi:hydroxyethylthiazole kinase-like uncharacterized protein yjeF
MRVFTAEQMRMLDRLTVERAHVSFARLMEAAGEQVVEAICSRFGSVDGKRCLVFCGKGNNGGDGAVIGRLLQSMGAQVAIRLLADISETRGEAAANFASALQLGLLNTPVEGQPELVVDALLGTGLQRPAEGEYAAAIATINRLRENGAFVVSVDIPSGLSSDGSRPIGPHVSADLTVSFTGPKPGNVLPPACYANGELVIGAIGTPDWLLAQAGSHVSLAEESQVAAWLRASRRAPDAHKNSIGDVLLIAGSPGKTGAAALASEAILRAGAGLATVAVSRSALPLLVSMALPEVMTAPLDEADSGGPSESAIEDALKLAEHRTVVALGPGLTSSFESTRRLVRALVERRRQPIVIDADGLNSLAPWPADLRGSDDLPIIITPHAGEMARLTGRATAEVVEDRLNIARDFAMSNRIITVLKGSRTIVAAPNGEVSINPTGNAGMATAGSGDVLTGIVAGLLAQRPAPAFECVVAGVYLHGLAGDLAAASLGARSLIASSITDHLGPAILRTGGDEERLIRK